MIGNEINELANDETYNYLSLVVLIVQSVRRQYVQNFLRWYGGIALWQI